MSSGVDRILNSDVRQQTIWGRVRRGPEDVWCVCNIDCSHISFNPVCASDGRSYDNPCQVKEASCQKQERIEVKYLGHCQGDIITGNKGDGHFARTDLTAHPPCMQSTESRCDRSLLPPCRWQEVSAQEVVVSE
ncbi:tomoregulin-2 [Lates japonicus]|uniref:Tomoregulin-2 n=1 Tax=Lates japonicus TaxID=270547 RepID=A0AAD3MW18_LATJO|nr:tomoregulin-2 [Lates japonicus]